VSQRFLAQLEGGDGNISIARLADVAAALEVPVWHLLMEAAGPAGTGRQGDGSESAALRGSIAELIEGRSAAELVEVHRWLAARFERRARPVALLGLRGAGKTTVGAAVARRLDLPFVELDGEIERAAGMSLGELFELEGTTTYRRLQREVLARLLGEARPLVLATGGSIVTDSDCFHRLKTQCLTVWLRARPIDHWNRVVQQGDHRPMAANQNAMAELEALYAARQPLYAEADLIVDTSELSLEGCVEMLAERLRRAGA
jgi:XRE family aerobic/anaerobic benzoate catabolism transcriptional regulator